MKLKDKIAWKINRISARIIGNTLWKSIIRSNFGFKLYNHSQESVLLPRSVLNYMVELNRHAENEALNKKGAFIRTYCSGDIVRLPTLTKKTHWQFLQSYRWHDPFYAELIRIVLYNEQPGVFLDIGANQGLRSIDALDLGWEVHAIEPNKEAIHFLSELYEINNFTDRSNLKIHRCCAGSSKGQTNLHIDESSYLSQVTECLDGSFESTHSILCDINTVADIIQTCNIEPAQVVAKIDTEGFESEVIKGMEGYQDKFKALFVELNPRNTEEFLELTSSAKMCLWIDSINDKLLDIRKQPPMRQVDVLVVNNLTATTMSRLEHFLP